MNTYFEDFLLGKVVEKEELIKKLYEEIYRLKRALEADK